MSSETDVSEMLIFLIQNISIKKIIHLGKGFLEIHLSSALAEIFFLSLL